MVEIVSLIPRHPQLLHHAPRARIRWNRHRHHFLQCQLLEPVPEALARPFGRQSPIPERPVQAPADLHARGEMRVERRPSHADEAGELARVLQFRGIHAKPVALHVRLDAIGQCVAFLWGQTSREELHHARVGIQAAERLAIGVAPPPQPQPWCL